MVILDSFCILAGIMSKIFHWHKNRHPKDDVEAHPTTSHDSAPVSPDLGEYPALDRYISTYRDEGGAADQEEDQGLEKPKWWQFWKSRHEDEQAAQRRPAGVPDAWLATDIHSGMSQSAVNERRRFVGWNELTTEKKNILLKIITYFMGPILYGKHFAHFFPWQSWHLTRTQSWRSRRCWRPASETGLTSA